MKFEFDWPSGFRESVNDDNDNDHDNDDNDDDGAWLYHKLICEPSAQVS